MKEFFNTWLNENDNVPIKFEIEDFFEDGLKRKILSNDQNLERKKGGYLKRLDWHKSGVEQIR